MILARLVSRLLSSDDRQQFVSDLSEEYERRRADGGARRWYLAQIASSAWHLSLMNAARLARKLKQRHPAQGDPFVSMTLADLRYSGRALLRSPVYTSVAVITIAVGVGANTTIFSIADSLMFRGVSGIDDTAGLIEVSRDLNGDFFDISYPVYEHLQTSSTTVSDLAAFQLLFTSLSVDDDPQTQMTMAVTPSYFTTLGVGASVGRLFGTQATPPDVDRVAVISDHLWERRFGRNQNTVGQVVKINGTDVTVIGVLGADFRGHSSALGVDIFVPLGVQIPGFSGSELYNAESGILEVIGRLADGNTIESARQEFTQRADLFLTDAATRYEPGSYRMRVLEWGPLPGLARTAARLFLTALLAVAGMILTIACVNVAGMLLSRGVSRRREVAVRIAMGCSRSGVVRLMLTETLLVFLTAGIAGFVVAWWIAGAAMGLAPQLPAGIVPGFDLSPNWHVVLFATAVSLGAGVVFGVGPALRASSPVLVPALKDDSLAMAPERTRVRSILIGFQMAVTVVLLIVAGLFSRALEELKRVDTGWSTEGVYTMSLDMELTGTEEPEGRERYETLLSRVRAVAGVESATLAAKLPLSGSSSFGWVNSIEAEPPTGQGGWNAYINRVSEDYFETLDITLIAGRDFDEFDRPEVTNVAIINSTMARNLFPAGSAIGKSFYLGEHAGNGSFEVVGVVEDAKYKSLGESPKNFYYLPWRQFYNSRLALQVAVATVDAAPVLASIQDVVRDVMADMPIEPLTPMQARLETFFLPQRIASMVAVSMGILGLLLGIVGIYGVTAFSLSQRVREFGVRMALGANVRTLVVSSVLRSLRAPIVGLGLGLLIAASLTHLLGTLLGVVRPTDPLVFTGVAALMTLVAAVGALVPALGTTRVDPVEVLRSQ